MSTAVFDTLKASDTLKAAGIEARQAEAIVHTMAGAFEDTVATKADLMAVEGELKQDIASTKADLMAVKGELKQDIASTKADLIGVKAELEQEIASTKAELEQEIASTRAELKQDIATVRGDIRLLKWMIGVVLACVAFPILKSLLL